MRKIIHIDMDAFFASVEQRNRPELRGRPVIVGGSPERRGVVSTCSYEARRFGVHSAMPSATARRLCPVAVFIEPDHRRYAAESEKIIEIFQELTGVIEQVSIDEAYLDVTENSLGWSSAGRIARYIRNEIRNRTGLTASAGVSYNKFLAKVASDHQKPDGLTVIAPEQAQEFLDQLKIEKFHGLGKVAAQKLRSMNIRTGADLRKLDMPVLKKLFGKSGVWFYYVVRGIDDRPVEGASAPKSISREITFDRDIADEREMRIVLRTLARKVFRRAVRHGFNGKTANLKVKYADFKTVTRSAGRENMISSGEQLGELAVELLKKTDAGKKPVRLLGVGLSSLLTEDAPVIEQLVLPLQNTTNK